MQFGFIFAPAGRRLPVIERLRKEAWSENMMMTHGINVNYKYTVEIHRGSVNKTRVVIGNC